MIPFLPPVFHHAQVTDYDPHQACNLHFFIPLFSNDYE
jgi:hypothetical protein